MSVKNIKSVIHAKDTDIAVISAIGQDDYISLPILHGIAVMNLRTL